MFDIQKEYHDRALNTVIKIKTLRFQLVSKIKIIILICYFSIKIDLFLTILQNNKFTNEFRISQDNRLYLCLIFKKQFTTFIYVNE